MLRDFAVKMRTSKCCVSQLDGTMHVKRADQRQGFSEMRDFCCEDANEQVLCESVRQHDACQRADQLQEFSEMLTLSTQDK